MSEAVTICVVTRTVEATADERQARLRRLAARFEDLRQRLQHERQAANEEHSQTTTALPAGSR